MKRINGQRALKIAYDNLYGCDVKKIDKNLDALIKAKKFAARNGDK